MALCEKIFFPPAYKKVKKKGSPLGANESDMSTCVDKKYKITAGGGVRSQNCCWNLLRSRVEAVEEVVDVRVDDVAVGVDLVEDFRVGLVLAESTHLGGAGSWVSTVPESCLCVTVMLFGLTARKCTLKLRMIAVIPLQQYPG